MPVCITDVSLCTLPLDASWAALPDFAFGLLALGVDRLEMPVSIWERLHGAVPAARVSVVVSDADELERLRGEGVGALLCETGAAAGWTERTADLTVAMRADAPEQAFGVAARLSKLFARVRVQGLDEVMAGDYAAVFAVLTHLSCTVALDAGNRYSLAAAAALEWTLAGGREVCAAFRGRGGHAPLEQLLAALRVLRGASYRLEGLPQLCKAYTALTGEPVPLHAPVAGRAIFTYESGIHADGIRKDPKTYEPFAPETVGAVRRLSIGKHSGRAALREKLDALGVRMDNERLEALNEQVRARSTGMRRGFTDAELLALVSALQGKAEN